MVKVKIYVEGGGESKSLHTKCREGFRKLLEKAGFVGHMPRIIACGSRREAFDDFRTAMMDSGADEYPILLVDSEGSVSSGAWEHLHSRDGWDKPLDAEEDQAHLMVQCMETWCIADRETLRAFFGQHVHEGSLPPDVDLENRAKDDVQNALMQATRQCGRDREYSKGKRSFELLARLNPETLRKLLPHFTHLCDVLNGRL